MTILADELGQHCTAIEYPLADGNSMCKVTDRNSVLYMRGRADRLFVSESMNPDGWHP